MNITEQLAKELNIKESQAAAAVKLIDEGNTIPFIARYRKEVTGSLDDTILRNLFERLTYIRNLEKRKEEVKKAAEEQDKLTPEIESALLKASTLTEVEDIYRPFKQKKRTRASIAKEKGLEPLALKIFEQNSEITDIRILAKEYINSEKGVESLEDALKGASDIIAEMISDNPTVRKMLKLFILKNGVISSKGKTEENSPYNMYYDYNESVMSLPGHRILAMNRGEKDDILKISLEVPTENALSIIGDIVLKNRQNACSEFIKEATVDSYSRLIFPSLENEMRNALTDKASTQSIGVFSTNLHQLLMQPPLKGRTVLGLDPAYRTGCKIAVVDPTGKVLDTTVVYPTPPQSKIAQAEKVLTDLILKHDVSVISIGNGTASKESEIFVANLIKKIDKPLSYMVVSEAGASVYSASKLAAEEFPEYDVSLRSAVSIARRLQDPLAELVKIEPKAIGVGQYQHDMPQKQLNEALSGVVEDCVNSVGVDVNTASPSLLSYVSGIGPALAKNIISYREENGAFTNRKQLMKVPKLGKKAFEQCAGFLRIPESENILDNTAVHPESYNGTMKLLSLLGYSETEIKNGDFSSIKNRAQKYKCENLESETGIGSITLHDIMDELLKPGRDPRESLPPPMLRSDLLDIKDLKPDMILDGTVRNVIDFGAFIDIGVHQDGLVHISNICDRFIKHPSEVLKVGDIVKVKIISVDLERSRIALSMKDI